MKLFKRRQSNALVQNESGATAIEYALIAGAMAVCLIAAMPSITGALGPKFTAIGGNITTGK
jgi:pilus assembly protein Flp/PilA